MLKMSANDIRLGLSAENAEAAIRAAGAVLVETGAVAPEYIESLLAREQTATTYLGNGLAIPHGRPEDAHFIHETRVVALQIPEGVTWQGGQTVKLIFAIAAKSDEHIGLLRQLTGLVGDEALAERLAHTTDVQDILAAVQAAEDVPLVGKEVNEEFEGSEMEILFTNPRGFHLRPAGKFSRAVKKYAGEVTLVVKSREVEPDSPTRILNMGISAGDHIRLRVKGPNETDTISELAAILEAVNHEPQQEEAQVSAGVQWHSEGETHTEISATMAAPGLAVAPVWKWSPLDLTAKKRAVGDTDAETADLRNAIDVALQDLRGLTEENLNEVQRDLFDAHASLLEDAEISSDAVALIRKGEDALSAWRQTIESQAEKIEALGNENLMQRAVDMRDIGLRVQKILLGASANILDGVETPVIFVADDLQPSDAAQLQASKVKGICLKKGSPNAHAAIVARSLGIPMIVAAGEALDQLSEEEIVILDASGGRLIANPSEADLASAKTAIAELAVQQNRDRDHRFEPAMLKDGHRVEVMANLGQVSEAAGVIDSGAEGVGLLRTEFMFLDRSSSPDEMEQYTALKEMITALQGLPMIVRSLDIGGDKPVSYLGLDEQDLSFLGLRGFRLAMARPDLARTQLRAIYRAAAHGPIRLMFPMIATVNDFYRAREMAEKVRREVGGPEIELGIMIEVPSAVVLAEELAEAADFFSIGTNDLTQYTLAMDRTHPLLAKRTDSLHPAVLRLIDMTVKAAHGKGKWVGVCGALAGDPLGALILTGLGVDELSMPPAGVAGVKALLRQENLADLSALACKALTQRDARSVRALRPNL
ncbi:phosphoenolpyruvate--protein phosphotransferase [Kiritimatiellaeota bacterium B1221]|nr:phosphoenolpyruvate--protein phosphotransferase [Kiritimatiellaeota bacterium B1221]